MRLFQIISSLIVLTSVSIAGGVDLSSPLQLSSNSAPRFVINSLCDQLPDEQSEDLYCGYRAIHAAFSTSELAADKMQALEVAYLNGRSPKSIIIEGSLLQLRLLRVQKLTTQGSTPDLDIEIKILQARLEKYISLK